MRTHSRGYPQRLFLARGHSKDHRPVLKQLVYNLSIADDGAVPVHYKVYPGNRTDDSTHISTWSTLCAIAGKKDFLYVADCKVCTDEQLHYIDSRGGRVITIMPETWKESEAFKEDLRQRRLSRNVILRRPVESHETTIETFSCFFGKYLTRKRQYRLHWIHSSQKRLRDRQAREAALKNLEQNLADLNGRLNKRSLKTRRQIRAALKKLLAANAASRFLRVSLATSACFQRVQDRRGRPGPKTTYTERTTRIFVLHWTRDVVALKRELHVDGIFPLLCTDTELTAHQVLQAYKFQPRLEKRFYQYKSVLNAAPLLFKKIQRVEAITYLYFLALILQAVIERAVRAKMKEEGIKNLPIYPEERPAAHPTTAIIFSLFKDVSAYTVQRHGKPDVSYRATLKPLHRQVLAMLGMKEEMYWTS